MTPLRNRLYYSVKPWMSPALRLALRRWYSRRRRPRIGNVWPILPGSETPPPQWPGWPEGKQFAVVLTHDVEGPLGLERCRALMELERRLGFRSSFYFIPEGSYEDPQDLRHELKQNGFEVGVHDLHHDGKLYQDFQTFSRNAERINHYLRKWESVGFRSGFMLHNLEWAHQLNVLYEASTFDTDPFEPQPEGVATIFPFWVPRSPMQGQQANSSEGYVELPYTLVQDSTLFLLLGERRPDVWLQKVDWLVSKGGMVLVDTHPDYSAMNGTLDSSWEYPVNLYAQLLEYIRAKYAGCYWHGTAHELAQWYRSTLSTGKAGTSMNLVNEEKACTSGATVAGDVGRDRGVQPIEMEKGTRKTASNKPRPKLWIDLDNTPHVPFFEPIMEELRARGFPLLVTARDAFQVCDLADKKGLEYHKVGRHHGKHMFLKGAGLVYRALQLAPLVLREKPVLGVSHGARSQMLLGAFLRFPTVLIVDYEHSKLLPLAAPKWVITPQVIPESALQVHKVAVRTYPGIKEDVYAWKLKPDSQAMLELGLRDSDLIVTVRPPATEAHYHNPESEKLFDEVMRLGCSIPEVRIVLLPRNQKQGETIRRLHPEWFREGKTIIPGAALDGMNLIWHSDLVVSGGGTMNREAAALGVPVYSIFRGTIGAVDRDLDAQGKLTFLESFEDIHQKLKLVRRPRTTLGEVTSRRTLLSIVDSIQEIAEQVQAIRG